MSAVYEKLLEHWRATDVAIATPSDRRAQVEKLERRYGVTLPEDFRAYLLHAAPDEEVWDDGTTWWEIERTKNIPDEYEHPVENEDISRDKSFYIFFADYLCWCYAWAICCKDGVDYGKVAVINGERTRIVANDFAEFVQIFLDDPDSMS